MLKWLFLILVAACTSVAPTTNVDSSQQKNAFGENSVDGYNRMLRYELGKIASHEPLTSFGSVSETFSSTPDPSKIEFGQSAVTDLFGDSGKSATTEIVNIAGKDVKRGRALSQDVADLQSGLMNPDDLPIQVFQYVDLDGVAHWVTENNRHLTVLRMAKKNPTKIVLLKNRTWEKSRGIILY